MSRPLRLLACLAVTALVAGGWTASTQSRSVWSGVYSAEQADRGRRVYARDCAQCHGADLMGGEAGSELTGDSFLARWNKKSVGALYDLIRTTMPDASPGSMTERQYQDAVAYLLKQNAFPAGTDELPRELEAMTAIQIRPKAIE